MESLFPRIAALLVELGPWIVFAVVLTETAVFIGLVVPAEATVLFAAFLADRGYFEVESVLLATAGGALLGDSCGYMLGRHGGQRVAARGRFLGRLWQRHEAHVASLFQRHPSYSVSVARLISFVRTLMPWMAGMSGMPYRRFFLYDLVGVAVWATASVALGYLAGESWHLLTGVVGTTGAVFILVGVLLAFLAARRRRRAALRSGTLPPW